MKRFRKRPAKPLDLDASLRRYRPELRTDLLHALVQRAREDHRRSFRPGFVRSGLALGVTVLAVVALASVGGLGRAATSGWQVVHAAERLVSHPQHGTQQQVILATPASQQYFGNRCGQNPPKKPPKPEPKCPVQAGNASVKEGNSATKPKSLVFPVSIGDGLIPDDTVTVVYTIVPGTATPVIDYTPVGPGTLTFAAGETLKTVSVPIIGDTIVEPNETLFLVLSNPSANAFISVAQGTGTIINDD